MPESKTNQRIHDAVIIGAGFGGMGAAIQLRRLGYDDLVILDREDDLGGTWHVNHYPGLAVDIPSSTYSYSFEPNPYWTRLFAPGTELKKYAEHVADKYDLRRHMRFGMVVKRATWHEEDQHWEVETESGESIRGTYILTATGFLSQPKLPDIPGIDEFRGKVIHTADWDHSYDLNGKRAAVIGTGATAVQLIPTIADQLSELTVYQRTAIWVSPKPDLPVPAPVRSVFAALPLSQRAVRLVGSSILEVMMVAGVLHYKKLPAANNMGANLCRSHLKRQIKDRELRRKLTPTYSFGCKRPTFSNDYYPTFTKKHVHLEINPIQSIDQSGIITEDGQRTDIDVLVLATGFDLWETNFPALEIIGRNGKNLGEFWRQNRFQAYEGIAVPGFPNLLSLNSPYSYSGLNYFTTIESQMKHMERLLSEVRRRGSRSFEVTEEANTEFLDRMTARVGDSIFELGNCSSANSYYFNQHGEATLLRPTTTMNAFWEAGRFDLEDYQYA
ncbi:MAG TPA: NAD(P)/FAD-dependent oxidoreductase [Marmoricola sp.]|nr:NAD(P)/FAD-dependent oxidoreductase [Marmoricola sp.]